MLVGCDYAEPVLPESKTFNLKEFKGYWHSSEYGYLLSINDGGMTLFDINDTVCIKKPISSQELAAELSFYKRLNPTTIQISAMEDSSQYIFRRVDDNAVEKCNQVGNQSSVATFEVFSELMKKHYAFFDLYQVNWDSLTEQHSANISQKTDEQSLFQTFSSMLEGINDAHLKLQAEVNGVSKVYRSGYSRYLRPALDKEFQKQTSFDNAKKFRANWYKQYKQNIKAQLLSQQNNDDFDELIIWGKIGDIGYINLLKMIGFSETGATKEEVKQAKLAMNHVMSQLKNSRGIIIDVTANGGGEDEVSRVFASYFTEQPILAYQKRVYGSDLPPQSFYIKPAKEHRFSGPVFLVTSDHTVSGAEIFTLAMRSMKNVTHIGETTRGALSDILDKTLPNGWNLSLSNEFYIDASGHHWESKGIPPQKQVNIFRRKNIYTSHLESMNQIIKLVENKLL